MWNNLEPETDKWDRRLLFEVTGIRLNESEYRGDDTSDEDGGEKKQRWRSLFNSITSKDRIISQPDSNN